MKKFFTLTAMALAAMAASAQWNTTNKPTALIDCSGHGDYYISNPKAVRTNDGKTWLSYKVWEDNGVHTYLQLLNKEGVLQFDGLGIKVNDYETPTWWSEYQLAVASDGSALVSVADSRSEGSPSGGDRYLNFQPAIYKVGQDGSFLWGLDGITFPAYQHAPYTDIFVNGDDVFFQFTQTQDTQSGVGPQSVSFKASASTEAEGMAGTWMNRISSDGTVAFSECKALYGQVIPSSGSDLLVFSSGGYGASVNKVNRDLEPVWNEPLTYDDNAYGGYEMRPYKIAPDGEGGAAVAFVRNMGQFAHNIRVQYVTADGDLGFGLTGIDAYNAEEYDHDYPGIALNSKTKEIMVDWEDQMGEYTQSIGKYSFSGERSWGETGIQILSKDSPSGYAWGRIGSGALSNGDWILAVRDVAAWANEKIVIMRLNPNGEVVWKKSFGRNLEVSNPTFIVEEDATYLYYRGKSSLDVLRVFNADGTTTGIENVQEQAEQTPKAYYTVDGKKLDVPTKGINIVRYADGSVRKVFKK